MLENTGMFRPADLVGRSASLWRYHEALGLPESAARVTLGEGFTPMAPVPLFGRTILAKMDFLCPTGSYKDRGSTVMLSKLREWGLKEIIEDSSGNAGASIAAYSALGGIRAKIYIPLSTSAGKAAQIAMYGAELIKTPGSREDTAHAAWQAASETFYASHNWSPYFLAGMKTAAYEIAEQLGWDPPEWVITPAGGGSLAVGLHLGFQELYDAGITPRVPRMVLVQAARCAPIYAAWRDGRTDVPAITKQDTAAEGISVAKPVRGREILEAARATNGFVHTVNEDEIWEGLSALGATGVYVEPTSAVVAAAAKQLIGTGVIADEESVVIVLTGNGLKATDKIVQHQQAQVGADLASVR
ncbi:MAG: threonine synthase [Bryobacteraceae bacterium]